MKFKVTILVSILLSPVPGYGGDEHNIHLTTNGIEALSPELRSLLSEEMVALQSGMQSIIPAYVSGNWEGVEKIAGQVKNSYILQQSLTKTQIHEMHTLLPQGFIEKDKRFHYLAGMLEHAAKNKKPELINFYFSEMSESCVSCHSSYATHRFPALKPIVESEHAHQE